MLMLLRVALCLCGYACVGCGQGALRDGTVVLHPGEEAARSKNAAFFDLLSA